MKKQAYNPYLPGYEYIPDGEPYVFGDRVYIYGSHDRFNGTQYCQNNYVCWSAPTDDLGNWRFEGYIYDKRKDPICTGDDRLLFAPDVAVGADGRYYLYYAFDFGGVISVAVCDTPAGEYEFYGHVCHKDGMILGQKEGDAFQFDPGVLADADGRVYLYSGFCPEEGLRCYFGMTQEQVKGGLVMELEPDMITIKTEPRAIFPWSGNGENTSFEGHEFFEASSIRKVGKQYYFIYSSINGHELCYAVSDYPDKDFVYGGTIVSNGDIFLDGRSDEEALNYTGNNHGSIIEIHKQWYVFYHRQTNRHQFSRQACAEKIEIRQDGFIPQTEITSCGLNGSPLKGTGTYEARIACNLMSCKGAVRYEFGVDLEDYHPYFTQDGEDREDNPGQYIANMTDGSIAGFKYFTFDNPEKLYIKIRGNGDGTLRVTTEIGGNPVTEIPVHPSDNWVEYQGTFKEKLQGTAPLYFEYCGSKYVDFLQFRIEEKEI